MVDSLSAHAAPSAPRDLLPWTTGSAYLEGWLQAQRDQFESVMLWQQSFAGFYRDLWDRWIAHCAGGAPIDA